MNSLIRHDRHVLRFFPTGILKQCRRTFLLDKYTPEEKSKAISILNDLKDVKDFEKTVPSMPKVTVTKIIKLRTTIGPNGFGSVDDLTPFMTLKVIDRILMNILDKSVNVGVSNPMFPRLNQQEVDCISSAVSICISGDIISWCSVSRKPEVKGVTVSTLDQRQFVLRQKIHFLSTLNEVVSIVSEIPFAPLYIVEEFPNSTTALSKTLTYHLQSIQIRGMLLGTLSSHCHLLPNPGASNSNSEPNLISHPRIISIKTIAAARLFKTIVGNEKVSGQRVINKLMHLDQDGNNVHGPTSSPVSFSQEPKTLYRTSTSEMKERFSNVMLLNMAYWRLTEQVEDNFDTS